MPLYEYKCQNAGGCSRSLQKFSDSRSTRHADCGGIVERLISISAFQFKGSGFYITDYTKKNGSSIDHAKSDGRNGGNGSSKPETTLQTSRVEIRVKADKFPASPGWP